MAVTKMWLPLAVAIIFVAVTESSPPSLRHLYEQIKWENGYNRYRADAWESDSGAGDKVVVLAGIYVTGISGISATDMEFNVNMYVQQEWNDTRLQHNESRYLAVNDLDVIKNVWRPDLYFANSKQTDYHMLTKPNFLMRIYPNGRIYYVVRVSGRFICNQRLHLYPNDEQVCEIKIGSFSYTSKEIEYRWFPLKPMQVSSNINLPEMDIIRVSSHYCQEIFVEQGTRSWEKIDDDKEREYSCLVGRIKVKRRLGYHMVQTYVPSMLIVGISWVSFWIDPHAAPARASLSVTTLLTLTTQAAGIRMTLPNVSYAKAIDLWMGFCTLMVFATLIEYAIVNSMVQKSSYLLRIEKQDKAKEKKKKHAQLGPISLTNTLIPNSIAIPSEDGSELDDEEIKWQKHAHYVDQLSRFLFPAFFFFMTAMYWTILLAL